MSVNVAVISYLIACAAYGILFLLLVFNWRGRSNGRLLILAVLVSLVWALVATLGAAGLLPARGQRPMDFLSVYQVLEVARTILWLALLFELLRPLLDTQPSRLHALFYPVLTLLGGALLATELSGGAIGGAALAFKIAMFLHIGLSVFGLALIENLFRNTRPERRWATKFLYVGVGALFVYDFYLYADALLLQRINVQIWSARGGVAALVVPLLAVAAARNPQWSLDVFVSRRVVIHSVAILGAGLYLLVMAGAGYYVRYFGGSWGGVMQLIFLAGSALLLAVLLFSGHLRSVLIVFLNKHFFNYKYDYRDEWLRFSDTLALRDPNEPPRQLAIRAIAQILHSPGGLLWTRGADGRYALTESWNMSAPDGVLTLSPHAEDAPDDAAFIGFLERKRWVLDIDEYRGAPPGRREVPLPDWLLAEHDCWLVVPLLQGETVCGFVVLAQPRASLQLNWEDWDLLKTAGRQVASHLLLMEATDALMDARQFDAFNRLSAYLVHDLKNIVAQLGLLVRNAERHRDNPAFMADAIGTVANATERMNRMLGQLRKGLAAHRESSLFDVAEALREALAARAGAAPAPQFARADEGCLLRADRDRFIAVIGHLLQNSQEATALDGRIEVRLNLDAAGGQIRIVVADNGSGMTARFVQEDLFRPFTTTKGNAGMGIGMYESREFVHALGGRIDVASQPGAGTEITLRLPLARRGGEDPGSPAAAPAVPAASVAVPGVDLNAGEGDGDGEGDAWRR